MDTLDKYLNEKISEATGIPSNELTTDKIQTLNEARNTAGTIGSLKNKNRIHLTRKQIMEMRKKNDEFLSQFIKK